jgi:predicted small lipoprotein YifL
LPTHALTRCAVLALALAVLGLSGCGRRGNLEAPPSAAPAAADGQASPAPMSLNGGNAAKSKAITAPTDSFILDPLL